MNARKHTVGTPTPGSHLPTRAGRSTAIKGGAIYLENPSTETLAGRVAAFYELFDFLPECYVYGPAMVVGDERGMPRTVLYQRAVWMAELNAFVIENGLGDYLARPVDNHWTVVKLV